MWRFFQNYKKISVANSLKDHLSAILNTRRAVNQYFYFNVAILIVFTIVVLVSALQLDKNMIGFQEENSSILTMLFVIGLVIAVILGIFGLLYYFVYGRFLRPLKNNEKELLEIGD
jgi:ethanolamine transporter EutH